MVISVGTGSGNKDLSSLMLGTSGGNKPVQAVFVGTSGGNKQVFSAFSAYIEMHYATTEVYDPGSDSMVLESYILYFRAVTEGGTAPFTYSWSAVVNSGYPGTFGVVGVDYRAMTFNTSGGNGTATCVITDSLGQTVTASGTQGAP